MSNNSDGEKSQANPTSSKADKLKQIDALYRNQIKQIYTESVEAANKEREKDIEVKKDKVSSQYIPSLKKVTSTQVLKDDGLKEEERNSRIFRSPQIESRINGMKPFLSVQSDKRGEEDKIRASTYLVGQSTRTIQILRKQNQSKQLKIRQLTNKCENLIEKLKNFLSPLELEKQMNNLKQYSDRKMERLENLFKIKNEEIFFKMKLQIIGLLQEFQISKQEINGINEVNNESGLYSFMVKKLKLKLKDFRSKEQESNFEIQKDKILNQKHEERIHYLMETNELLKLSQTKLKNKIQDLRGQLNQFLQKLKSKERQIQERQNEIFRLKKQNQELHSTNQKLNHDQRNISSEKNDERRIYEAKEKEMKALLSSYFLERKKLEGILEEKQGEIQEMLIREKFLQQENERINREYVRWKERYEWLEKEKQNRQRQFEEEKAQLMSQFMEYKNENNQGVYMVCRSETEEAMRKVEQYQSAYQRIIIELEEQRKLRLLKEEEAQNMFEASERQWLDKVKRIQKMREEEMFQLAADHENRQKEIREQYEKRQELLSQEMQARMKALLAQNDKKATEKMIEIENENDDLRKEIGSLNKVIEVKQSLINMLNSRNTAQEN